MQQFNDIFLYFLLKYIKSAKHFSKKSPFRLRYTTP